MTSSTTAAGRRQLAVTCTYVFQWTPCGLRRWRCRQRDSISALLLRPLRRPPIHCAGRSGSSTCGPGDAQSTHANQSHQIKRCSKKQCLKCQYEILWHLKTYLFSCLKHRIWGLRFCTIQTSTSLLPTHGDRQGVDISVTVCLFVCLYGDGFLRRG